MKLEPANIVCPACGSGNYMRHLIGKNVGYLDMKCINCNSYFNFDELYKRRIGEVLEPKPTTHADKLRTMSDEELAEFMCHNVSNGTVNCAFCAAAEFCRMGHNGWLDWLRQEAKE